MDFLGGVFVMKKNFFSDLPEPFLLYFWPVLFAFSISRTEMYVLGRIMFECVGSTADHRCVPPGFTCKSARAFSLETNGIITERAISEARRSLARRGLLYKNTFCPEGQAPAWHQTILEDIFLNSLEKSGIDENEARKINARCAAMREKSRIPADDVIRLKKWTLRHGKRTQKPVKFRGSRPIGGA